MQHILPFVGKNQYRFVGAVSRSFRISYFTVFSTSTSYENITTMEQAFICRYDLSLDQRATLCKVMIQKGRPNILKISYVLPHFHNFSDKHEVQFTAAAAESGDFELLRWLVEKDCSVDETAFLGPALNGDLAMVQWLYTVPRFDFCPDEDSEDSCGYHSHYDEHLSRLYVPWNHKIYENAAFHGHLPIIEWAHSKEKRSPQVGKMCSMAALNGHLHVLKWAHSKKFSFDESALSNAAKNGHLETVKWLRSNGCPFDESACANAAGNGHLQTLQWLRSNGCPWDDSTLLEAVRSGHEEVARWAHAHGCPLFCQGSLCDEISQFGNFNALKFAHSVLGFSLNDCIFRSAVCNGNINILSWLHENHCPMDPQACKAAVEFEHFEVLKWLHSIGCELDSNTMSSAAELGCMEMLQWLLANGCPWGIETCAAAAMCGQLDVLKWLRSNDCPWDWTTYESALIGNMDHGNLHVVEWAFANGCPLSDQICSAAAKFNHFDALRWARSHGVPWSDDVCSNAAKNKDLKMLSWALDNGCPFPDSYESLLHAFREDHEDVLNWFVKRGISLNSETFAKAALEGDFEFVRWLHSNSCPWDKQVYVNAAERGHHEILAYAREHGCPFPDETI